MEDERPHRDGATRSDGTGHRRHLPGKALDGSIVEQTMDVRAREHTQRTVGVGAGIEADAKSEDPGQHGSRIVSRA